MTQPGTLSSSKRFAPRALGALCLLAGAPAIAQSLPQHYAVTTAYAPPAATPQGARVTGVNRFGQAVGNGMLHLGTTTKLVWLDGKLKFVTVPIERTGAVMWSGGQALLLKPLLSNASSTVRDVNDSGWAVGDANKSTAVGASSYAVLWRNGTVKDLGAGARSVALFINAQGWVAGYRHTGTSLSAPMVPFVWRNNVLETLPAPVGVSGVGCVGLSDAGVIPCRSNELGAVPPGTSARRSFLWRNGTYQELTHPEAREVYVAASSANGTLAGTLMLPGQDRERVFLWREGAFTILPAYPVGMAGTVLSVSDQGMVMVEVWTSQLNSHRHVIYTPEGQVVEPGSLTLTSGEQLLGIAEFNALGQAAATVGAAGGTNVRQVLLTPVAP